MKRYIVASASMALIIAGAFVAEACTAPGGVTSIVAGAPIAATGSVLTYHNNLSRDGNYPYETLLTPDNVTAATFQRIANLPVDGVVYAQPLVAKGVTLADKSVHDLLIVATEHDSVYAFDVPAGATTLSSTPVWKRSFLGDAVQGCTGCSTLSIADSQIPNIAPEIGITATPVIDPATGAIYVVAETKENGVFHVKMHVLDSTSGAEMGDSPVEIQGSVSGGGNGAINGVITFDQTSTSLPVQLSRSGLVLVPGGPGEDATVMFGFSSYDDRPPAHGWMFAYDATTLVQTGTYVTTPNSGLGTIWMSGGAPAVDASGNIYFSTGNGDPDVLQPSDLDDSVIKLSLNSSGFVLSDWFTPFNRVQLDDTDVEVGSAGLLLLPDQSSGPAHLLVQGGKAGTLYLINRDNMGHAPPAGATIDSNIVDVMPGVLSPEPTNSFDTGLYSTPTYWKGQVFVAAVQSSLRAFAISGGKFVRTPTQVANERIAGRGASTSISSNGSQNGVIWMVDDSNYSYGWNPATSVITEHNGPAILYAYDPDDLSAPLYSSAAQGNTDIAGLAIKFTVPTVEGGHVFVGTRVISGINGAANGGEISVYGLVPTRPVPPPNPVNLPPAKLSATGFFSSLTPLTAGTGMVAYDVNSPLWSDGSSKQRWIKLPAANAQIIFDPTQPWLFPVGTQFIKHFALKLADGSTTNLETRVLTYGNNGWSGVTYQWTADQTDALLLTNGGTANYQVKDPSNPSNTITQTWQFPASNQCVTCHNEAAGGAIGVNTRQLNKTFAYASGTQNILSAMDSINMFTTHLADPTTYGVFPSVSDTTQTFTARARSYLNSNCAFCHLPGGPATANIDLRYDTPLAQMNVLNVMPAHGNLGVVGANIINPGNAAASVLYLRMNTEASGRMPPLSSVLIDPTGTSVIQSWINGGCTN